MWEVGFQRNQQGQASSETKAIPRNLNLWQRFSFVFLHFSISKIKAIHCISEQGSVNGSVLEHFLNADCRPLDIVRQCCRSNWLAEVNNELDNRGSRAKIWVQFHLLLELWRTVTEVNKRFNNMFQEWSEDEQWICRANCQRDGRRPFDEVEITFEISWE